MTALSSRFSTATPHPPAPSPQSTEEKGRQHFGETAYPSLQLSLSARITRTIDFAKLIGGSIRYGNYVAEQPEIGLKRKFHYQRLYQQLASQYLQSG